MMRVKRADERGFTLTELVVTVTILGLIAVPLCMSLAQAVKIAPEASARSERAQDRQSLADAFATDTARAQSVTLFKQSDQSAITVPASGSVTRTVKCAQITPAKKMFTLSIVNLQYPNETALPGNDYTLNPAHDVTYSVEILPIDQQSASVNVTRVENAVPTTVTVGYCSMDPADPAVTQGFITYATATKSCASACTLLHQSIDLDLKIRPQPQDPSEQVEFEGAIARSIGTPPS